MTERKSLRWAEEAPGNAAVELESLCLAKFLDKWMLSVAPHPQWQHAMSAWRVLGKFLMREYPDILSALCKGKGTVTIEQNDMLLARRYRASAPARSSCVLDYMTYPAPLTT